MVRTLATLLLLAAFPQLATAGPTQTLQLASNVLHGLTSSPDGIPAAQLADAYGMAVFPRVIKAGLFVAGSNGHGVLLVRNQNGEWGNPVFVTLGGASIGLQAGVESADVFLLFQSRASLDRLLAGTRSVTIGAAAGSRTKQVTDGKPGAEIMTYSRGRGLSAGVSLAGVTLRLDADANKAFARDTSSEARELVGAVKARLAPVPPVEVTAPQPSAPTPAAAGGSNLPVSIELNKAGIVLSAITAAAIGLAYRSARMKMTRRWGVA